MPSNSRIGRGDVRQNAAIAQFPVFAVNHEEGDRTARVPGVRPAAAQVDHSFAIAMIGRDDGDAAFCQHRIHQMAGALVHAFHGGDGGGQGTGVANHVRIGEIDEQEIVVDGRKPAQRSLGEGSGAHFRGQVVGRHLRRRNYGAALARPGLFAASVEEEGDVRVLFRSPRCDTGCVPAC